MSTDNDQEALDYHRDPAPGKISVETTKSMLSQHDLSLAYTPGVAAVCRAIVADPDSLGDYTAKGNLVAVITNGSAVLGLGNIGPHAAKPVMEGKAALFKTFANIDVFDLEIDASDPDRFVDTVVALAPTFGGVNLEDIKSPECFEIERRLSERLDIPVFHDDQHGTAICVAAAIRNGLRLAGKRLGDVSLVCSGAGAAAMACLDLLVSMGLDRDRVIVTDIDGVLYRGRNGPDDHLKERYLRDTGLRTVHEAIAGADIFLGVSGPGVIGAGDVRKMAPWPLLLALANPEPEIRPAIAHAARDDVLMATGRSDYPNQVNNVLCFPFMFRGALDVGATTINQEMKIACVEALAALALEEPSDSVRTAYRGQRFRFGRDYLLPKPFDHRLMSRLAVSVARAAMESGVAKRPVADLAQYARRLEDLRFRTSTLMRPVFDMVSQHTRRVMFAEGESARVLQAVQMVVDDKLCRPVLAGHRGIIESKIADIGLRLRPDHDFDIVDFTANPEFDRDLQTLQGLLADGGVGPEQARRLLRSHGTVLASLCVRRGAADAAICGVYGDFNSHLAFVRSLIGCREDIGDLSTVNLVITARGPLFVTDTQVTVTPSAEHLADIVLMAARVVERFGLKPRVALLSHSDFGSRSNAESQRAWQAVELLKKRAPQLEVGGEMGLDHALSVHADTENVCPLGLSAAANLLVMPSLDAASIALSVMKRLANAVDVGPILIGTRQPVHILTGGASVRGIVNMTAMAAADAI